jgi:hypothetical protein
VSTLAPQRELLTRLAPGGAQAVAHILNDSGATVLLADPQRCRLLDSRWKKTD